MKRKLVILCLVASTHIINTKNFVFPKGKTIYQIPSNASKRLSSQPYISGDTFRSFCDFVIDKTNKYLDSDDIKNGDTIFIAAQDELLDFFFEKVHPEIKSTYILVTHNSDKSEFSKYIKYLDDNKIAAWFGVNLTIEHSKAFPIPIGVANRYWRHGNINILSNVINNSSKRKNIFLYMNFVVNNNKKDRQPIYNAFKNKSFCHKASRRPFRGFLNDIARSTFVISPPGNGIDCHRTWEALYLGSIPLVSRSKLDSLFYDLPVIIVDDWSKVTKEFLIKQYNEISSKNFNMEKIFADYWFNEISKFKERAKNKFDIEKLK